MQTKSRGGILILSTMLLFSCGQQRKATSTVEKTDRPPTQKEVIIVKNPLNIVRDSLLGTWAKRCDNGVRTAFIVDTRIFAKTYLFYADKECSKLKYTVQFGGEYQLNTEDAKEETHMFDGALQFATMKLYTDEDVKDFNSNQIFGYADWDTTTAKNILDKGFQSSLINPHEIKSSILYSVFTAEGEKMWLADFATQKDKRALELSAEDGYKKVK